MWLDPPKTEELSPLRIDRGRNTLIVHSAVLWAFLSIKTFLPFPGFRFGNVQSLNILLTVSAGRKGRHKNISVSGTEF